jgi:hypothetical protein
MALYTPTPTALPAQTQVPADGERPTGAILGGPHEVAFDAIARIQGTYVDTTGGPTADASEGSTRSVYFARGWNAGLRYRLRIVGDQDLDLRTEGAATGYDIYYSTGSLTAPRTITLPSDADLTAMGVSRGVGMILRFVRAGNDQGLSDWENLTIRRHTGGDVFADVADFSYLARGVDDRPADWAGFVDVMLSSIGWRVVGLGGTGKALAP